MQAPVQEIQAPTEPQVPVQIQGGSEPVATPAAVETTPIQGGDLEGGKRKRCPKGKHRKGSKCVRHSKKHSKKSHRKSKSRKMRGGETESVEQIVAETIQGGDAEQQLEGGRYRHRYMWGGETEDLEAGKKHRSSKSRKAVVSKAKKMCVKASGSTSKIRASIKKAKKSKSAMKKRCNSKKNKSRRASRRASRK